MSETNVQKDGGSSLFCLFYVFGLYPFGSFFSKSFSLLFIYPQTWKRKVLIRVGLPLKELNSVPGLK